MSGGRWMGLTARIGLALLIALFGASARAEPFSITCARDGWYFLTFDDATKRVVHEAPSEILGKGPALKGRIDRITDNEIFFYDPRGCSTRHCVGLESPRRNS
jgi:hypothetical protein